MVATGQEMVRDKDFFKVRGKSENSTSSQGKFYGHVITIIIGHEIEQQTDGGFSRKSILFAHYC